MVYGGEECGWCLMSRRKIFIYRRGIAGSYTPKSQERLFVSSEVKIFTAEIWAKQPSLYRAKEKTEHSSANIETTATV